MFIDDIFNTIELEETEKNIFLINKLEIGMEFKNFIELSNFFDKPILSGNSKKSFLKELSRYCNYRKDGQKFIITDVHNEPLPKKDNRHSNNTGKFKNNLQDLLVYSLSTNKKNTHTLFTRNDLFKSLGMFKELPNKFPTKEKTEYYIFNDIKLKQAKTLESMLNSAKKNMIIDFEKIYIVSTETSHDPATEDEYTLITDIKTEVLRELKCNSMNDVYSRMLLKEHNDLFNKKIKKYSIEELGYSIDYVYSAYSIVLIGKKSKLNSDDIIDIKTRVNKNLADSLIFNISNYNSKLDKKTNKSINNTRFITENRKNDLINIAEIKKLSSNYIDKFTNLVNEYVLI